MPRQPLPIGIQTFREIREEQCYYVDKTGFALRLVEEGKFFPPWWFETGTPIFLVDLLTQRGFFTPRLARLQATEALLSAFDVEDISNEALLWQTGYLTFSGVRQMGARTEYSLR
ncbi:hypothetical protein CCR82_05045 [Halochromatium salexigens]|uniref:AAA-ATPase-like domain-containing protein n=1 Tax=Halochromatium salexigens TaxID=49447 RepID=A0AAJ0XFP4_HALSE|nr:hypothetical protein [Halochromatium salexigens]